MTGDDRCWRVGELASATGLTIKALHHCDGLGLLIPSQRTSAGHRLYGDADVQRLYRMREHQVRSDRSRDLWR